MPTFLLLYNQAIRACSVLRSATLLGLFLLSRLLPAAPAFASDPAQTAVDVVCPAVVYDDANERGRDVPHSPRPVRLTVVAKLERDAADPARDRKQAASPADAWQRLAAPPTLIVERVLFGAAPGTRIRIEDFRYAAVPADAESQSYIYSLVVERRDGKAVWSLNGYYSYDRIFPMSDEPAARAFAQARLDWYVLGASSILVAKPAASSDAPPTKPSTDQTNIPFDPFGPESGESEIAGQFVVERVLHGSHQPGQRISLKKPPHLLPSWPEEGPVVFLLDEDDRILMRWPVTMIEQVNQSLARRDSHPVRTQVGRDGASTTVREIILAGTRASAIDLLSTREEPFARLASRRLLVDGEAAVPDVTAAVERELWNSESGERRFLRHSRLIRILAELESRRTDGRVTRLIDDLLAEAEGGRPFPGVATPSLPEAPQRPDRGVYDALDDAHNHSLAWLLLAVDPDFAAQRYAARLARLRDIAAYGWKDEAQWALDRLQLLDRLDLKRIEVQGPESSQCVWEAGLGGVDLSHYHIAFSRDGRLIAVVSRSKSRVWRLADQTLAAQMQFAFSSVHDVAFSPDGRVVHVTCRVPERHWEWDIASGEVHERSLPDALDPSRRTAAATQRKLPFQSIDAIQIGDQWWTLEEIKGAKPPGKRETLPAPDDPFDVSAPNSVVALRRRDADDECRVRDEQELGFRATQLILSGDGKRLAALGADHAAIVSVESGEVATAWLLLLTPRNARELTGVPVFTLSHDGSRLAVALPYAPPRVFDMNTGKPVRLHLGHHSSVVAAEFVNDEVLRTRDASGVVYRWNASTGERVANADEDRRWHPERQAIRDRERNPEGLDELGRRWLFVGQEGGKYMRFGAYDVYVRDREAAGASKPTADVLEAELDLNQGRLLGRIHMQWGQYRGPGLVPGGEYLHVETQIFSRRDLHPVSAVNLVGETELMAFSADGRRYALATFERDVPAVRRERVRGEVDWRRRVRVHDTRTGKTLFSRPTTVDVRSLAISPDLTQLAVLDVEHRLEIWPLPGE
ncbi:MAG: WD40 repeat domain-containing protein [Pirellulales bacterium]